MKRHATILTCTEFRVNAPEGWRQWIAEGLRRLSRLIDKRAHIAIEMGASPEIEVETAAKIIDLGLQHMADLLKESVTAEGLELGLQQLCPRLYEGDE